jgi:hypothetical protein
MILRDSCSVERLEMSPFNEISPGIMPPRGMTYLLFSNVSLPSIYLLTVSASRAD